MTPHLLNDDGSASVATALMMSHHAFRRDLARFARALRDGAELRPLREEWQKFREGLHHHHQAEDTGIFPGLRSIAAVVDALEADHRRIDPLLERGDQAFAALPDAREEARAVVERLLELLRPHLETEEEHVIPFLRAAKEFPPPKDEAEASMYAQGFAWASHGIAPEVLEKVDAWLPEILRGRLAQARAEFAARCERVWGTLRPGAARTPIPDGD